MDYKTILTAFGLLLLIVFATKSETITKICLFITFGINVLLSIGMTVLAIAGDGSAQYLMIIVGVSFIAALIGAYKGSKYCLEREYYTISLVCGMIPIPMVLLVFIVISKVFNIE